MSGKGVPVKGGYVDEAPEPDGHGTGYVTSWRRTGRSSGKTAVSQAVSQAPEAVSRVTVPMPEVTRTRNYAAQNAGRTLTSKQRKRLRKKAARGPESGQASILPDGGLPNLPDATRFPQYAPGRIQLAPGICRIEPLR